jgi:hypothetical protein
VETGLKRKGAQRFYFYAGLVDFEFLAAFGAEVGVGECETILSRGTLTMGALQFGQNFTSG